MTIISCRPLQYSGSTPDCGFGNPGSTPGKGIHFYTTNNVKERNYLNIEKDRKKGKEKEKEKRKEREKEKPTYLNYLVFIYQNIL